MEGDSQRVRDRKNADYLFDANRNTKASTGKGAETSKVTQISSLPKKFLGRSGLIYRMSKLTMH